ncbi:hydroxymethylglutaryl-CoA lyase [Pseudoruegeria sp. SK021]|uniref:hydroxymethylglutaryl-CoA lyase n=1 Tax=Pseudoruegeria sp. SK021 TaxID=1933035 RepID=UPI000A240E6E|nr:hydroxymethylglutaryl-CoA lyase [Pseudoruegeria sp. SK021]OSP53673.1 hydroxymethylglutaryl-CoA lyase [Pseudoruegeria sp. SK021]
MSFRCPEHVETTEVGPRDGLQSEPVFVPTAKKIELAEALIASGLRHFEMTSFVSPRAVPQMRDAAEVMAAFRDRPDLWLTALVPNAKGAERSIEAGVDAMVVFMSASESHNLKNVNQTRQHSLQGFRQIADIAQGTGVVVQGSIATAFGCPFEGEVPVADVVEVAKAYRDLGITRITLGDTTGVATPPLVAERCRALREAVPDIDISLHFHNTRGVGLVCAYAGLLNGISRFESSVGGLGGCPFVPRATGNISTEDFVYMLDECGIGSGVDLPKLCDAAKLAERIVGRALPGQVMKAGPRLRTYPMDAARTANG